jgi:DNA-binding response OmpR family regulator
MTEQITTWETDAGTLAMNHSKIHVYVNDKRGKISPAQWFLLKALGEKPGWVMSRDQLITAARGADVMITERTIDVHISQIRKKLGRGVIRTIIGHGYSLGVRE